MANPFPHVNVFVVVVPDAGVICCHALQPQWNSLQGNEEPPEPGRNLARKKAKEEEQDEDADGVGEENEDEERWQATAAGGLIYR